MDETKEKRKMAWVSRLSKPILFVLVIVTYFVSEAFLRRTIYDMPRIKSADKTKLLQQLPGFIRGYLEDYSKRLELKAKLKEAKTPEERAEILYALATQKKDKTNTKTMMRVIDEIPHSVAALKAWTLVLRDFSDQEILDKYVPYVQNCDIRTPRQKVRVWQLGASSLKGRSKEARLTYMRMLVESRVCSSELTDLYEEVIVNAEMRGEMELARTAKALQQEAFDIVKQKAKGGKRK